MKSTYLNSEMREERHINKKPWTAEEDNSIVHLVNKYGPNWVLVSNNMTGRTGKQCRERYYNHLQSNIKKGDWTQDEDQIILRLQAKYGNHWVKIMRELPGRTDNAIKNRFHALGRAHAKIIEDYVFSDAPTTKSRSRSNSADSPNLYKRVYNSSSKRPASLITSNCEHLPASMPTPTSITGLVAAASASNIFSWSFTVNSSTIDEESAPLDLGVETDSLEPTDVNDCLSPLTPGNRQLGGKASQGFVSLQDDEDEAGDDGLDSIFECLDEVDSMSTDNVKDVVENPQHRESCDSVLVQEVQMSDAEKLDLLSSLEHALNSCQYSDCSYRGGSSNIGGASLSVDTGEDDKQVVDTPSGVDSYPIVLTSPVEKIASMLYSSSNTPVYKKPRYGSTDASHLTFAECVWA